jgi:hypothetical protein
MTISSLGTIGTRLDLLVKQGADLGPFTVTMKTPAGMVIDLTGCSFTGKIRRRASDTVVIATLSTSIIDVANGVWTIGLPASATSAIPAGETLSEFKSLYTWDMKMQDASGKIIPLYYGDCKVFREVSYA